MATATKAKSAPKKKVSVKAEPMDGELEAGTDSEVIEKAVKVKAPRKTAKTKAPPRQAVLGCIQSEPQTSGCF